MKTTQPESTKVTASSLASQVKIILHSYGLSKAFNEGDFRYFRSMTAGAFNQAQQIAEHFVEEYPNDSDYNSYLF